MVYLFCGLFGTALIAIIVIPLFRKDNSLESAIIEETEWDLLLRKKDVILGNIQDLDFEYKCGKLSDEDYRKVRSEMSTDVAAVLQKIDDIESSHDMDALIRREVSARRGGGKKADRVACPACRAENPTSNKFCAECGGKLKA